MANRPTTTRRSARKRPARRRVVRSRLTQLEAGLPPTLRAYVKRVRRQLDRLEKEIERASEGPRRNAARLLRDASHRLGRYEARGPDGWRRLTGPYRREAQRLLERLEHAVGPEAPRKRPARPRSRPRQRAAATPGATSADA